MRGPARYVPLIEGYAGTRYVPREKGGVRGGPGGGVSFDASRRAEEGRISQLGPDLIPGCLSLQWDAPQAMGGRVPRLTLIFAAFLPHLAEPMPRRDYLGMPVAGGVWEPVVSVIYRRFHRPSGGLCWETGSTMMPLGPKHARVGSLDLRSLP